jgi:hypothetical protein
MKPKAKDNGMLRATDAYNLSHKTWGQLKQVEMGIREATRLGATEILVNAVVMQPAVLLGLKNAGYIISREDDLFRIQWNDPGRALGSESPSQARNRLTDV